MSGELTSVQPDLQLSGTFYSSGEIDTQSDDRERAVYPAVLETTVNLDWSESIGFGSFFSLSLFSYRCRCAMSKLEVPL